MNKLIENFAIIFSVTLILFLLTGILQNSDRSYLQQHLAELTTTTQVESATYYEYKNTPYTFLGNIFFYAYLIMPAIFVIYFSISDLKKNKRFLHSLFYPLLFIPFTFLLFSKQFYDVGMISGEGAIGLFLIAVYTSALLILVLGINGITYLYLTKHH